MEPTESPAKPAAPTRARLWAGLVPALTLPFLASFVYFVLFPGTTLGNAFYGLAKIHLVVWPIVGTLFILREKFQRPTVPWRDRFKTLLPCGLLGAAIVGLMYLGMLTPLGDIVRESGVNMRHRVEGLGVMQHYLLFTLFVSVLHSFLEELYWRWFVFGNLRRVVSLPVAHIVAAVGFSAHHIVVVSQFFPLWLAFIIGGSVGLGGLFWSLFYQKQKTMLGIWFSHMIVDFGMMTLGYQLMTGGAT